MRLAHPSSWSVFFASLLVLIAGCDFAKMQAEGAADFVDRVGPAFEAHWDYEMAGESIPGSIMQLEGLFSVAPDNQPLHEVMINIYMGYGFGWLDDQAEIAEFEGDFEKADRIRNRIRLIYERAADIGKHWIALNDDGFDPALSGGLDEFEAWLKKTFTKKKHGKMLTLTGYAWGSMIGQAKDDMAAVADLPFTKALVQRGVELDPEYKNAIGLVFLAVVNAESLGGDLDLAKKQFEEAIKITKGRQHLIHVAYGKSYATKAGNRELFESIMNKVITAGDVHPQARLPNIMAKRRASRYMENIDQYF